MPYGGSNNDVIDDITWPWKVKVVIPISFRPVISKTALDRDSVLYLFFLFLCCISPNIYACSFHYYHKLVNKDLYNSPHNLDPLGGYGSHLIHQCLSRPHSPPLTASRPNQPLFRNSLIGQTDIPTDGIGDNCVLTPAYAPLTDSDAANDNKHINIAPWGHVHDLRGASG